MKALKDTHKVVGYFSYNLENGHVLCDGDACIISGSENSILMYKEKMNIDVAKSDVIRKTTFGDVMNGLLQGGAYAFDEESYNRFFPLATKNEVNDLPTSSDFFSKESTTGMHFARIQLMV